MRTILGETTISLFLIASVPAGPSMTDVAIQRLGASHRGLATVDLSADGEFVAFVSSAALSREDTNGQPDIYVLDRTSGRVTLESRRVDGAASGSSAHPRISGDGRFVVFSSSASTLVPVPYGWPGPQVFLRDRHTGHTTLISRTPAGDTSNGWSDRPEISQDGRFIVFESTGTDLTHEPDANGRLQDVYRYEIATLAMVRVSVNDRAAQSSSGASFAPAISGDGRIVTFTSSAPLDRGVTLLTRKGSRDRRGYQVFVRDMEARTTRLVSRTPDGREGNGVSFRPAISGDGRVVAFVSSATDLERGDTNRLEDVYRHDIASGRTTRVSRPARDGSSDGRSDWPAHRVLVSTSHR